MTLLALLLVASSTWNVCLALMVRSLWRARQRTYQYAVDRADFTPAGCAYNDMATVIVLDGDVTHRAGTVASEASP